MEYCRKCGAQLQEGAKFCPQCGAPAEGILMPPASAAPIAPAPEAPKKKRGGCLLRGLLALLVISLLGEVAISFLTSNVRSSSRSAASTTQSATRSASSSSQSASRSTAQSSSGSAAPSSTTIRPEVKEFLDSYEACMNEYVDFMKKYMNADPSNMASMLGDYYSILSRYTAFAEKIDQLDESQLTTAELNYYIEVTSRVSQKLLTVAGY